VKSYVSGKDVAEQYLNEMGRSLHSSIYENVAHPPEYEPKEIFSLVRVRKFLTKSTGIKLEKIPMCRKTCEAFVGPKANLVECSHCHLSRYRKVRKRNSPTSKTKDISAREMVYIDFLPRMEALFRYQDKGSVDLEAFGKSFNATVNGLNAIKKRYKDWYSGSVMERAKKIFSNEFFADNRESGFVVSMDGATLNLLNQSSSWLVVMYISNYQPAIRWKKSSIFVAQIIPGPKNPIDLDSFLFPLYQRLARASYGFWMWDGLVREYFLWKGEKLIRSP
jgi:hypothetical protein